MENRSPKYKMISAWLISIIIASIWILCKWVIWSTMNGGFWAKYGDYIFNNFYRWLMVIILIVNPIVATIKYFKSKGDNNNEEN